MQADVERDDLGVTSHVDLSVVVVSYNALEWLSRCLAALEDHGFARRKGEVIVVDNNSDAAVQTYLAGLPHGIRLIQQQTNTGFGRACNAGVRIARGRYVALVNPDAVVEPGSLDALVDFLEADLGRGLVGGRTLTPSRALDPGSCWGAPSLWSYFCAATGLTRLFRRSVLFDPESLGHWQRDTAREVDIVSGCLLLTQKTTWTDLGGFDEQFFMYGEDADLSLRARAAGYRPSITPEAVVIHALSASSNSRLAKQRLLLRGKVTLVHKHWTPRRAQIGTGLLMFGVGGRALAEWTLRSRNRTMRSLWQERRDWSKGWGAPVRTTQPTDGHRR